MLEPAAPGKVVEVPAVPEVAEPADVPLAPGAEPAPSVPEPEAPGVALGIVLLAPVEEAPEPKVLEPVPAVPAPLPAAPEADDPAPKVLVSGVVVEAPAEGTGVLIAPAPVDGVADDDPAPMVEVPEPLLAGAVVLAAAPGVLPLAELLPAACAVARPVARPMEMISKEGLNFMAGFTVAGGRPATSKAWCSEVRRADPAWCGRPPSACDGV
ncbi:hypothetical protein WG922_08180 [Ramlibacter sp. AN1015]|uniref:hypothetical protein n=1 Tax=Ramlibacter sp. AN1015 TaxID=3133428 RepID=UPI0030BA7E27